MSKMALKTVTTFPIFAPPNPNHQRPATEVRFSRWNNANAQKFIRHERTQKQIEDDLRLLRRFNSAHKIANIHDNATAAGSDTFRSTGTPSTPSRPSIPGKSSKYSKTPQNPKTPRNHRDKSHPAFRRISTRNLRNEVERAESDVRIGESGVLNVNPKNPRDSHPAFRRISIRKVPNEAQKAETDVQIGEKGVSYVIPNAPFEFQYSYTETPKEKPLKLREPPIAPFGPGTMPRPWTGRKPLPSSKKKLEFDSFRLPPPHKKGVKPVQSPGPFLPGSGPKYVMSREEILGEPLTKEEIEDLIKGCKKSTRQLNMGRDGLTHNMLDNIHALWKRRRVCKIKCKGVCTVDMDNVRQQLEERTGGKIIYSRGGLIYLFRGRNYNDKTRPRFPLMLWKPITPVYPRLIQRAPEGLTLEEASEMRQKGRMLTPICQLGKNGVYCDLVKNVREAFEACELVRINCQGMNGSDYRKIGAKLKDLVPCVLVSFEHEHILMWRGSDWKSSFPVPENDIKDIKKSENEAILSSSVPNISVEDTTSLATPSTGTFSMGGEDIGIEGGKDLSINKVQGDLSEVNDILSLATPSDTTAYNSYGSESEKPFDSEGESDFDREGLGEDGSSDVSETESIKEPASLSSPWTEGVLLLRKQAVESGSAFVLEDSSLDADIVYERAVALAKSAPPGPVFRRRPRIEKCEKQETGDDKFEKQEGGDLEVKEAITISENRGNKRKGPRNQKMNDFTDDHVNVVPKGCLRVDELAKLLA